MKTRLIGIIALTLALAGVAFGQDGGAKKAPKLVIAQANASLGVVKKGAEVKHTYIVKNEGTADLVIQNVAPS